MARLKLLLVDSEPRSLRVTGAGLSRHGFTVTHASGAEEALGKLRSQRVDVVVCSASLEEGLATLRRQLLGDAALASVPFLALAEPGGWSPAGGWSGFSATDVVTLPVVTGDLVGRVRGAVEASGRTGDFQSSLDRMSALDLVEHFRAGGRSGTVAFTGRRDGRLSFSDGAPVDATLGLHSGREAFFRMLASRGDEFEVRMGPTPAQGNLSGEDRALLEEGLAWVESWDVALEQVPPLSAVLEQDAVKVAARQSSLPEEAGWLLRLVDGERTVEDLVEASTLGGVSALEILARLYFEGLVSVRARAADPVRRPRVEEWLNTPPAVSVPAAASASGPATEALSREDFAALGEAPTLAVPAEPVPAAPSLSPEELAAFEAAAAVPAVVEAKSPTTQTLSREELAAFEAAAAVPTVEAKSPTTQTLSREELAAFEAAAAVPAVVDAKSPTTQTLSREELAAFEAPAPAAPVPEPEPVLPSGFMDEGGFPMGVSLPPAGRRPVLHGRHETPAATPEVVAAAVAAPAEASEPKSPAGTAPGWVPFERVATAAPAAPLPEMAEAEVPAEPPPPEAGPDAAAPEQAPPVEPAVPDAQAPAPGEDPEDDDVAALLKPSRSRWVLGGLAAAGIALVGVGAYFGLRPSLPEAVRPQGAPVAAAAPAPEVPVVPDAGSTVSAAHEDPSDVGPPDAGAPAAAPVADAPAPAVASPPVAEVAPVAAPAQAAAPTPAALPAPEAPAPSQPAAAPAVRPAPVAAAPTATPVPNAVRPAPAAAAPASPSPATQPIDLRAAKTPPPQGSTAQDRVAPGLLPRKAPSAASVATDGAASARAASTAAAVHVRGAKQAMQYGLWKLAADSFRKAMALGADTPDVKAGLGICLVSADSGSRGYQEAVVVLRQALAQDEGNARAWLSLGMAYQFLGNNPDAVVAYKRYLALQPNGKSAGEVRAMLERL